MYLTEAIVDAAGATWPMVGIFPTVARMQKHLAKLGYIDVETCCGSVRGHQFRYSDIDPMPGCVRRVWREPAQGYQMGSVIGSYIHLHFLSCPAFAQGLIRKATEK